MAETYPIDPRPWHTRRVPSLIHDLTLTLLGLTKKKGPSHDPAAFTQQFLDVMPREPARIPRWVRPQEIAGLDCLDYTAPAHAPGLGPVIVYLPGGSYSSPIHWVHFRFGRKLADALGARIVFVQYPLAPEHTWRDSRHRLIDLVSSIAAESPRTILAGDSAGGGYALSVAQGVHDAGGPQPDRLVLISPWVDLTGSAPGIERAAERDPWLEYANLPIFASWWGGSDDVSIPALSPGFGSLDGLPPTLALCGTRDLLYPENRVLADLAHDRGVDYTLITEPDLCHVYPILPSPEANRALDQIIGFLR